MMAQWLGCRTRNHKVASPVTAVSSLGIGSLNHNSVPDMTRWLCNWYFALNMAACIVCSPGS